MSCIFDKNVLFSPVKHEPMKLLPFMTFFYAHNGMGRLSYIQSLSPVALLHCVQDEMEELRSEMLEMRDMYMEEDVYQLQELRQQLEQVRL